MFLSEKEKVTVMLKVLFLVNKYKPDILANSICIQNVVEKLATQKIEIHILAATGNSALPAYEQSENVHIYRVLSKSEEYDMECHIQTNKKHKPLKLLRNLIIYKLIWPALFIDVYCELKKRASSIIRKHKCCAVVSCSGDFLSQIIGYEMKKKYKSIKWVPYFNDPLPMANRFYNKRISTIFNLKKAEKRVFKFADKILMEKNLVDYYRTNNIRGENKIITVGVPLFVRSDFIRSKPTGDKVTLVFIGSIDRINRNPEYLFEVLHKSKADFQFFIYGACSCKDLIARYDTKTSGRIQYMGVIPHETVMEIMEMANFLVNICNTVSFQIPSKILEYMGTGLPIINVVKDKNDSTIEIINKYGNGINILENSTTDESVSTLDAFLKSNRGKTASTDSMSNEFKIYDPEYTSRAILASITQDARHI